MFSILIAILLNIGNYLGDYSTKIEIVCLYLLGLKHLWFSDFIINYNLEFFWFKTITPILGWIISLINFFIFTFDPLSFLIFFIFFSIIFIILIPVYKLSLLKSSSLFLSFFIFIYSLLLIYYFSFNLYIFVFEDNMYFEEISNFWLNPSFSLININLYDHWLIPQSQVRTDNFNIFFWYPDIPFVFSTPFIGLFNIDYQTTVDALSLFFILLTTFLIPICFLISWSNIKYGFKLYSILLFLLELILINVFVVTDLVFFYIFFESVLIPMFLIIGIWGSRDRKIHAAYQFFLYTLFGSFFFILPIIYISWYFGTSNLYTLSAILFEFVNFDMDTWLDYSELQFWLGLGFFISLGVKTPLIPVHIWLPEAHVEAPTAGSVILAGILLKMGGYAMVRFMLDLSLFFCWYYAPIIQTICIIGIIYASMSTIVQIDLKKIIAYSSVAHMSFVTLGIFSFHEEGILGSIFLMLGHGIVSSGLFICVGILYDRYHTRLLKYYGGLTYTMPLLSFFFLMFTLGNISFPGTVNFIGEFLVLLGLVKENIIAVFFSSLGIILGAIYAIWLYNRVFFYKIKIQFLLRYNDINRREFFILLPFLLLLIFLGLFPDAIICFLETSLSFLSFRWYPELMYQVSFEGFEDLIVSVSKGTESYQIRGYLIDDYLEIFIPSFRKISLNSSIIFSDDFFLRYPYCFNFFLRENYLIKTMPINTFNDLGFLRGPQGLNYFDKFNKVDLILLSIMSDNKEV